MQVIAAQLRLPLPVEDLRGLPAGEREARGAAAARRRRRSAPFDLERGPLLRARLLRLGEDEHWLLLTLHHIVTDGWSIGRAVRASSRRSTARAAAGEPSPLPALPVQYADYAVWQREWLQGEVLEQQLAYWKPALAELPALELPTDRPRPAIASYRGGRVVFEIDAALTRRAEGARPRASARRCS